VSPHLYKFCTGYLSEISSTPLLQESSLIIFQLLYPTDIHMTYLSSKWILYTGYEFRSFYVCNI